MTNSHVLLHFMNESQFRLLTTRCFQIFPSSVELAEKKSQDRQQASVWQGHDDRQINSKDYFDINRNKSHLLRGCCFIFWLDQDEPKTYLDYRKRSGNILILALKKNLQKTTGSILLGRDYFTRRCWST